MLIKDERLIRKMVYDKKFREQLLFKKATDKVHKSIVCRAKIHRINKEKSRLARILMDEYRKK